MEIDLNIQKRFSKDENELFSILREVAQIYTPSTEIYLVGGAVRDFLLGIKSSASDIDVMLSNISGENFAKLVTKHLNIKDPHTIKSNPEKSKFITTASANIPLSSGNIIQVDFAQARSEIYHNNSRIPEIKPATPQEDAHRRDLTINSLMFNLKTNKIEDFTGMGIKDLISMTIRTPEDPLKTFSDDPLRIWRTIRFAAKYNGTIDPATYQAIKNPQLRDEIKKKVSKERIGQEFIKILKNPNSSYALKILKDTGLWEDVISEALKGTKYEGKMSQIDMDQNNTHHKLNLWEHTLQVVMNILNKYSDAEPEKKVTMILAALMHDLGKLFKEIQGESKSHPSNKSYHGHENESKLIAEYILKYLKIEPYVHQVAGLSEQHMKAHRFTEQEQGGARALRKFLRIMGEQSLNWLDVFNLSVADAYSKGLEIEPETITKYRELEQKLQKALVSLSPTKDATKIKPILDGNEIMSILGVKPGPHMKEMGEFVKELMDDNPNITKEEAATKLKEKFQTLAEQPIQTKASKASTDSTDSTESTCSNHIIQQKMKDLQELLDNKMLYEANSIMNSLKVKYVDDEKVTRLIAINMFKSLTSDNKTVNNDLLQYILDKASENFFDSILNAYAFGILMMTKTSTSNNVVKEVASRVKKMSPGTLRFVVENIPKTQIVNTEAATFVKEYLNRRGENE